MSSPAPLTPMPFIVGLPRSGTTLLRMMLDSHRDLAITPKSQLIPLAAAACAQAAEPRAVFIQVVTEPASNPHWQDWQLAKDDLRQAVDAIQPFDLSEALRAVYRLYAQRSGKVRWGDKNTQYLTHMPLIENLLPEARFIHLIRDGRAQWLSESKAGWGAQTARDGALRWSATIEAGRRAGRRLPHYLEVCYEQLVCAPAAALQEICTFLDLPWDEGMLNYPATAAARLAEIGAEGDFSVERRRALLQNTTRPPDPSRINAWQTELPPADIYRFEQAAGDTLSALGYKLTSGANPAFSPAYRAMSRLRRSMAARLPGVRKRLR